MATRKHKRKSVSHSKNRIAKHSAKRSSVIRKYPRAFFYLGAALIAIGIVLLITGSHNNAKVGMSMLSIFIGGSMVILANLALPKKTINN
ncbi:MAG: hypothetical protein ACJAT7_001719 [Psychromonas sp.]|jgi:hypothetical protein|uniref:hypothetical protein n=1 Tax=Psychromonas sp. TaxID=1884585 RepID=UPI0039E69A1F